MSEWISVKDRLPEIRGDYLIYADKYDEYYVASWSISDYGNKTWRWVVKCECVYAEDDQFREDMVTHWMPLPNFPEDL